MDKDNHDKRVRRKSLSMFSPSMTTPAYERAPSDDHLKKNARRHSGFFGRTPSPPRMPAASAVRPGTAESNVPIGHVKTASMGSVENPPWFRRKSLRKKSAAVFGSLRSLHSLEDDDKSVARSKGSSYDDDDADARNPIGSMVLHHGEVQTTGGMWRKKSQYLVLTDTYLIRFKNQSKAADVFSSIPASSARPGNRHSLASVSSLQDMQVPVSTESSTGIPLNSIIAVYMLDDGRPSPSVEVAYLDERTRKAAFIQMQTPDSQELNLWMAGMRSAARLIRTTEPMPFDQRSVDHVARMLEYERDYDPETFRVYRVIQMASSKSQDRSSADDLTKLSPVGCYLAIGSHKVHLIPLQKIASRASVVSLTDLEMANSFGLMNLTSLSMEWGDDSLHLTFRVPLRKSFSIFLASVHSLEIAYWIRQQTEFLRPLWTRQPYDFVVPNQLQDSNFSVDIDEDYGCFDRTLVAYSASYDVDTSNIRYTIDMQCDDAPCFKLLPPASSKRKRYTALELIAVLRALRYNEGFQSISFNGVSLDALQGIRDFYGLDVDALLNRGGARVHIPGQENLSVLSHELRALALKSALLRRLDFSYSLSRVPMSDSDTHDPGCGIPEAIFPVCRRQLTHVDWVVLDGIKLGDSDLDYLVDAASQRASSLRALEVGNCGLSVHDVDLLLSTVIAQERTLESINISGVQGRLNPDVLHQYIGYFHHIKKINLCRISRTSGPEPLITPDTLLNWSLEELSLSQTAVNKETVNALAAYLASDSSKYLRVLRLDQCGLTGQDVATLLHSMGERELHMHLNENRIDSGCSALFGVIAQNETPTHLSMRMIDFKKEDHFRELIEALRKNRTLRYLDISKASLPYDAGTETCKSLQRMFEENDTLQDLDISGESAHLDVARFGIGLNLALTGLKKNTSLQVLRIEHQKLGLQGANTLASVLEDNTALREVYCENNDINLQSFTVLVNGLQKNKSLLSLSCMERDKVLSLEKVRREFELARRDSINSQNASSSSIRRSLHAAMNIGPVSVGHKLTKNPSLQRTPSTTSTSSNTDPRVNHDLEILLKALRKKWEGEVARLRRYLLRNYNIANGLDVSGDETASERPVTAGSMAAMMDNMNLDPSPQASPSQAMQEFEPKSPTPTWDEQSTYSAHSDIFHDLDSDRSPSTELELQDPRHSPGHSPGRTPSPTTSAYPNSGTFPFSLPVEYASTSTSRLAVPVPAIPPSVTKTAKEGSIRSNHSSSSVSTNTGTGNSTSTRSGYGVASSTLRGFLNRASSRDRQGMEQIKSPPQVCVASSASVGAEEKPPQLDWAPPKFDFQDFST